MTTSPPLFEHPPCTNPRCGKPATIKRPFGWCSACYQRWRSAGRPESGPPDPQPNSHPPDEATLEAAQSAIRAARQRRLEQFLLLDRDQLMPDELIAREIGVTTRTVCRYRAAERAAGRGWRKNSPKAGRPWI